MDTSTLSPIKGVVTILIIVLIIILNIFVFTSGL